METVIKVFLVLYELIYKNRYYISPDNLKSNHIDISLTRTYNCNSKLSNKKYIHLLFSIFQKNQQENHSPSVVYLKDFAFALKAVSGKFL